MELRELNMQGLPGLPGPFTITGQPGLNLILGPNGSGKTSFVRAALAILWPDDDNSGRLAAVWREGDGLWHASCADGRHVQWQHDGQPHEPPPLPPVDQSASFRLGLLDLLKLAADRSDTGLARAIRNQMAGGYDLGALLAAEKITGREGQTAAAVLKDAEQQVADLRRRQQELQKDEAGLVALTRRAQAARAASGRADALKGVKAAIEKRAAFQAASSRLAAGFPAIMDRLRAEDSRNLKMWRARQHDLAEQRAETQRELERSGRQLDTAGLRDGGPASTVLDTARKLIEQAHRLAADLRRARADHAAAEAALDRARLSLAPWGLPDPGLAVDREALRKTARDMQSLLEARAQRDGLDRVLASAVLQVPETSAPAVEILSTGRRALQSWLGAKSERRWPWVPLAAGLVLIGLGIVRQPWSSDEGAPIGWIALLAGVVTLAAGSMPRLLATDTRRARLAFGETGLPEPEVWTDPEVRRRLAELADQEVEALLERQRQRLREELNPLRDQAARAAGDDQPGERLDGAELLYRSAAYCEALSVCDETEARCRLMGDDLAQIIAAVGNDLAAWSSDAPAREAGDLQAMETAVEDLLRRRKAYDNALSAMNEAERRLADQDRRAAETAADIASLLQRLGLDPHPDSDAVVHSYTDLLEGYRADKSEADRLAGEARIAMEALDRLDPPWQRIAREALDWPPMKIAAELQEAGHEAASYEEVREQIVSIQTRRREALHDTALDKALIARDQAFEELSAERSRVRKTALRRLLVERLQQQHRRRSEPPVLQRARALFHGFTTGRYELLIDERDHESFRARDTVSGEGLALTQLSDGTRAQLLLAARLAYIHEVERGVKVPLFFDESLTASDPERFAAIGTAVLDLIVNEKRQVFYLTCDPADVEAWQQLLAARGQPSAAVVDLAQVRGLAAAAPIQRLRVSKRRPVPASLPKEDPADYAARLGDVPSLDLFLPSTSVHLFHLLRDDLPMLHALLERRVEKVGQVEPLAAALMAGGVVTRAQIDALRARARALDLFLEAAAIGRGRPVPPGAITTESGLTSSKLPKIEQLLASPAIDGDAARLMDALERGEVSRLHQSVQVGLGDWLAQAGYLDSRGVLSDDDLRARVLQGIAQDIEAGRIQLEAVDALVQGWLRGMP